MNSMKSMKFLSTELSRTGRHTCVDIKRAVVKVSYMSLQVRKNEQISIG